MSAAFAIPDYASLRAINWSSLKHLHVSPLLYQWRIAHPEPKKPAFIIGGATHCATLEPDTFDARYRIYDGTRRGKEWDAWCADNPGVESLKPDDLVSVQYAARAVRAHRVADGVLRGGRREEVLTWTDSETKLACKGRVDYIRPDFIAELKTARDVRPLRFERAVDDYLYKGQVAFYHDGAALSGRTDGKKMPWVVAVQNDEPYDVAAFEFEPAALDEGREIYRSLLRLLVICTESNYWPGVAPDPQVIHARRNRAEQFQSEEW